MVETGLEKKAWWGYIEDDLKELFKESFMLVEMAEGSKDKFHDYAFVVFPAAKAYEGFLKKVFLEMGFISEEDYFGKRFRIGKALNPSLEPQFRFESIYDKLVTHCGGKALANELWETWRQSRNLVFHWFPKERNAISLAEARERIEMILSAMDATVKECKI